ncbi:hypothetical protein L915_12300 [Phytophthora nicotianae]|uniref:Uncharacterized protein n=1 Tax=Phytophthora nicotianae TaxID=4792 RepID=W2GJ85_PHYNI|nr:hypothetical protein L915_12300 [Phytophthora nicotianae]
MCPEVCFESRWIITVFYLLAEHFDGYRIHKGIGSRWANLLREALFRLTELPLTILSALESPSGRILLLRALSFCGSAVWNRPISWLAASRRTSQAPSCSSCRRVNCQLCTLNEVVDVYCTFEVDALL